MYHIILIIFCLKLSDKFNSFHFSHTTSLHSNITDFVLTYHTRVSSLELIPNYLVVTWSPEHNYLGGVIPVFRWYALLPPTVVQPDISLNNTPVFQHLFWFRPLYQPLDKELTILISRIQGNILSTWDLHPATTWTSNPRRMGILPNDLVSWEMCQFQRIKWLVKINPGCIMIYMCLNMQPQFIIPGPNFTYISYRKKLLKIIIKYPKMWC